MRERFRGYRANAVVYFADDDNAYDLRVFDYVRQVKSIGFWAVGKQVNYAKLGIQCFRFGPSLWPNPVDNPVLILPGDVPSFTWLRLGPFYVSAITSRSKNV